MGDFSGKGVSGVGGKMKHFTTCMMDYAQKTETVGIL